MAGLFIHVKLHIGNEAMMSIVAVPMIFESLNEIVKLTRRNASDREVAYELQIYLISLFDIIVLGFM